MSTDTDRISLDDFIEQHGITATVVPGAPEGAPDPDMGRGWERNAWTVTIESADGAYLEVPFFTGMALGAPTVSDVLECLALDAAGYENARNFEDWADGYGYDTDSRRAERTFRDVETQTENLRAQLGYRAFEQLLWRVDTD